MDKRFVSHIEKMRKLSEEGVELCEAVREGRDSLGSKLGDFVLVHYGFNAESLRCYKDLQEQLVGAGGREVLVFHSVKTPWNAMVECGQSAVIGPDTRYEVNLDLYFGKLSGKRLDFDVKNGIIIFPTGRNHVSINSKYIDFVDGDDLSDALVGFHRSRPRVFACSMSHLRNDMSDISSLIATHAHGYSDSSGVLVGQKVGEYFDKAYNGLEVYSQAKELLGIKSS